MALGLLLERERRAPYFLGLPGERETRLRTGERLPPCLLRGDLLFLFGDLLLRRFGDRLFRLGDRLLRLGDRLLRFGERLR